VLLGTHCIPSIQCWANMIWGWFHCQHCQFCTSLREVTVLSFSFPFQDDVADVWDFDASAEKRDTEGGTSRRSVMQQAEKLKAYLEREGL